MTTQIDHARVSKAGGSQVHDLQRDAIVAAGVDPNHIYEDAASGRRDMRHDLGACLKVLRCGDTPAVWKLDRSRHGVCHLVNLIGDLTKRGIGLKALAGEGASIDTTTANGRLVFAIFAGLAEFEREPIVERTRAGPASARTRGRHGMCSFKMMAAKLRLAKLRRVSPKPRSPSYARKSASCGRCSAA